MPGESHFLDIARVIQLAIAPVFLLTAIGTIIGVLTARLARAVDRRRFLEEHVHGYAEERRERGERELELLHRRIVLVTIAMTFAVLAALLVCLLIGAAFLGAIVATDLSRAIALLFTAAVVALTLSLIVFLREILIAAKGVWNAASAPQSARERRKATAAAK